MRQVSGEDCEITGGSRTDSGAHALGAVAHFDSPVPIEPASWKRALNDVLPADVGIREVSQVEDRFHARFSALDRWYRYRIAVEPRNPLTTRYVHDYGREIDLGKMEQAAEILIGKHDFLAFSQDLPPHQNARREIYQLVVQPAPGEIWIDITATAFARGMMRRISGALLEIGRGFREVSEIPLLLDPEHRDALKPPVVLPAKGLHLMRVRHGNRRIDESGQQDDFEDGEPDSQEPTNREENEQNLYSQTEHD